MTLGPYTLVCQSYTQDDNPNASSEWAVMDLYRGDRKLTTLYPERRVYKASNQPQTIPRIYSTLTEDFLLVSDVYVVYEGVNQDNGHPIIKAHLNPLVPWIWTGWLIMVFGTIIALIPNASAARVTVPARVQPVSVGAGD
jgi:cytochrome c-type biogenesis protein CcmF